MLFLKKLKSFLFLLIVSLVICIAYNPFVYADQWKPDIKFLTISSGAQEWEVLGAKIADLIHKEIPEIATTNIPGGSTINAARVNSGETQIGITHSGFQGMMIKGIDPFTEPLTKVRGLMGIYNGYFQVIANRDSDIYNISDLGKRPYTVWVCNPGTGFYFYNLKLLDAFGVSVEKIREVGGRIEKTANPESVIGFQDRRYDCCSYPGAAIPYASIITVNSKPPGVRLLPVDGEGREKFMREVPGTFKTVLPANTYQGQEEEIETIGLNVMLVINADLSDELVYRITGILMRNVQEIKNLTKTLQINFVKDATNAISIPLHPGAKRYYEEHGSTIE